MSSKRFKELPPEVWRDSTLHMCPNLVDDFKTQLTSLGRFDDACGESPVKLIGGADEKSTNDHFTWRFDASSVRTRYLILDPDGHLKAVSEDLLVSFADGTLAILELPCGSGAGVLGFLSLVANMRRHRCLARLPLDVSIVAGDISGHACTIYDAMLSMARAWLKVEGIRLEWQTCQWDASDLVSTTKAIDLWLARTADYEEHVVLIAAFSGAGANNFKKFEDSFKQIAARLHDRESTILLVEPRWEKTSPFFSKLESMFSNFFATLFGGSPRLEATFQWKHPFKGDSPTGNVAVLQYERGDLDS